MQPRANVSSGSEMVARAICLAEWHVLHRKSFYVQHSWTLSSISVAHAARNAVSDGHVQLTSQMPNETMVRSGFVS